MERLELYKGFRIRAYEDWSGRWLAEARKPAVIDPVDTDWITTPSGHLTANSAPENVECEIRVSDSHFSLLFGARKKRTVSPHRVRRRRRYRLVPDSHGTQSACDDGAIDSIPIADEVARRLVPGECLS